MRMGHTIECCPAHCGRSTGPNMIVIDQIKQWNARLILTGEKPVWWKRILIRVFIGKAAD